MRKFLFLLAMVATASCAAAMRQVNVASAPDSCIAATIWEPPAR
jgi:hypothetical protein